MPKSKQPKRTWSYTKDFKVKAVEMSLQDGIQVKQVAEGLDIHPIMLSRWRREYREGKLHGDNQKRLGVYTNKPIPRKAELSELSRLKEENVRMKKEIDLLKKWQRYLAEVHQSDLDSSRATAGD